MKSLWFAGACALAISACAKDGAQSTSGEYIYVWAGDKDGKESDFLAVIDARGDKATYGDVVATLAVGSTGTMPHHTQYEYPANDILFANGWLASRTFVIDLADPVAPKLNTSFDEALSYSFPHSYAPLDNGNILATFQGQNGEYGAPGGLVEFTPRGEPVRAASAVAPGADPGLAWPYSLAVVPGKNRAIVAMSEMGMPPWTEFARTNTVQIWSTEDLSLVASVTLPDTGADYGNLDPAEPRVTDDGRVFVTTFTCGVFRIDGVDSIAPSAHFVHLFPGSDNIEDACSVPVIVGDYLVIPSFRVKGLIALDISDGDAPKEAARLVLDERYRDPHWIGVDRKSNRLVVTGAMQSWVLVVEIDPETGALSIDEKFGGADGPGITFDRAEWPHGATGAAEVHAALFRR